jgi:competence transcription factor ComK
MLHTNQKPFTYDALVFLHPLVSTHAGGTESGHMLVVFANGRNASLTLSLKSYERPVHRTRMWESRIHQSRGYWSGARPK